MRQLFRELKRRNVYRVAVTYAAVAFVTLQAARLIFPATTLEGLYDKLVVLAFVGFPIALVIAWAFELTPEGIQRTSAEVEEETRFPREKSRLAMKALVGLGLVGAAVAGGWYLLVGGGGPSAETAATADTASIEPRLGDRSIAVLPFEPLGQQEPDAFTEGMPDDLLARLSNVSDLKVISRTSVQQYRGTRKTTAEIARELGVRWVLEGGVQEMGEEIQVNVQLIDPRTDTHAWADSYRRDLTAASLFDLQSEITKRIARSLEARFTPEETERVERQPTGNLEAYRLYVRGRRLLDQRRADSIREAWTYFQRALRRDSSYALAWSGLADAGVLRATYAHLDSLPVLYEALMPAIPEAKKAARRAVELDPDLAEARTSLAYAHVLSMEGPTALTELQRAVELKPSYSQAQDWLGGLLLSLGQPEAALRHLELAVDLNPEARNAQAWLNNAMVANGRYKEALAHARRRDNPWKEGRALLHLGRWEAMGAAARRALAQPGRSALYDPGMTAYLALADVAKGDSASARRRRAELEDGQTHASPVPLGLVHAALGNDDAAIEALGRIFEEGRDLPPPHLGIIDYYEIRYFYPEVFGPLRGDPRFQQLIREANRAWGLNPDGSLPESVDVSFGSPTDG